MLMNKKLGNLFLHVHTSLYELHQQNDTHYNRLQYSVSISVMIKVKVKRHNHYIIIIICIEKNRNKSISK